MPFIRNSRYNIHENPVTPSSYILPHATLKDRRKQWQKDCINWSWSRCGSVATERSLNNPIRAKRVLSLEKA